MVEVLEKKKKNGKSFLREDTTGPWPNTSKKTIDEIRNDSSGSQDSGAFKLVNSGIEVAIKDFHKIVEKGYDLEKLIWPFLILVEYEKILTWSTKSLAKVRIKYGRQNGFEIGPYPKNSEWFDA